MAKGYNNYIRFHKSNQLQIIEIKKKITCHANTKTTKIKKTAKIRRKSHQEKRLNDLPIEIIDSICKFVSPIELANLSLTCSKFNQAAKNHFRLNHQNSGKLKIVATNDVNFIFEHGRNQKYEIRFRSLITNIELHINHDQTVPVAFQFLNDNCAEKIHWLKIYGFDDLHIDYRQIIQNAEQLESVHTLILNRCSILGDTISKIFKGLKLLSIENLPFTDSDEIWLNQFYPKLSTFWLLLTDKQIDLTNLLRNSPELNTIYTNNLAAVRSVLLSKRKLWRADVRFWDENDFLASINQFKNCGNQMNISILNISFASAISSNTLQILMHSKHVNGLHYVLDDENINCFPLMNVQPNLKELCLRIEEPWTHKVLESIARCYPKLNSLRLYSDYKISYESGGMSLKNTLDHLIGKFNSLEHLYVDLIEELTEKDADDLNAKYSTVSGTKILRIYLKTSNEVSYLNKLSNNCIVFLSDTNMICPICSCLDYQGDFDFEREELTRYSQ